MSLQAKIPLDAKISRRYDGPMNATPHPATLAWLEKKRESQDVADGEPPMADDGSPYLDKPVRSPERMALEIAVNALKHIVGWSYIELWHPGDDARDALNRIRALVPDHLP
jgi:hypothetical protein